MRRIVLTTWLIAATWCGTATYAEDQDVPSLIRRLHTENHLKATQTYFDMRHANEAYQAERKAQQEARRSKRLAETAKVAIQPQAHPRHAPARLPGRPKLQRRPG